MSNYNQQQDSKNVEKPDTSLAKFAAMAFNASGFIPFSVGFQVTLDQLKPAIAKCVRDFISDLHSISFMVDYKSGNIDTFVWLPAGSSNLQDTSPMNEKSAIKLPITRYSKELKEFMERFCTKDHRNVFKSDHGPQYVGIQIDLVRIMEVIFDKNCLKMNREYKTPKIPTKIRLTAHFDKGSNNGGFGRLRYLEIVKAQTSGIESELKPVQSFKSM